VLQGTPQLRKHPVVLNNYSKNKKNACQHEKRSTKKKLTTLNN
jgi:hypothetical protein